MINRLQTRVVNYVIHDIYIKSIIIWQHFDIGRVASHYSSQLNNFVVVHNLNELSEERDIFSDKFYKPNHINFYLKVTK